jgi:hypothetical protein
MCGSINANGLLNCTLKMTAYCIMPEYCDRLHRCDEAMLATTTQQLFSHMPDIVGMRRLSVDRSTFRVDEECKWFSPASIQFCMLC